VETVPQGSTSTVVQSGAQPSTGSNVAPIVVGAAVVLALGGLAFVISRRREWEE
jgi:LPXTG-motif cell wall-anchored protein